MTAIKRIGIFIDHSSASLIEFSADPYETITITSKFTHEAKESSLLRKGELHMHKKENHQQAEYYKKIGEAIKQYDEVVLFGPTNAKVELFNLLKADNLFAKIKIEVKQTDKMTDSEKHSFVREYFSSKILPPYYKTEFSI